MRVVLKRQALPQEENTIANSEILKNPTENLLTDNINSHYVVSVTKYIQ